MKKSNIIQALDAMYTLDSIITEEDWLRIINKGISGNVTWYIIDNGEGDELTVMFTETGIIIKGFDHENELNPFAYDQPDRDIFSGMPQEMSDLLTDDEKLSTTFCMWYLYATEKWYQNEFPDNDGGKSYLMGYIHSNVQSFTEWAEEYYDRQFSTDIMEKVFNGKKLSDNEIMKIKGHS